MPIYVLPIWLGSSGNFGGLRRLFLREIGALEEDGGLDRL